MIDCITGKDKKKFDKAYRAFWKKRGIAVGLGGVLKRKKKGRKINGIIYEI